MSTELAAVGGTETLFGPLLLNASSPEYLLVDEESSSTYPLLTPSPPAEFEHPLTAETPPVLAFVRQLSPTSLDTLSSSAPAVDYGTMPPSIPSPTLDHNRIDKANDECPDAMASSSSSSSVLQDTTSSAQLLNPHHYLNLANDVNCQENGGIKQVFCGLQLGKSPKDFYFLSWNWPLIRKCCFWGVTSLTVACVCVIIAYITTLPSRCDPPRAWYQGSIMYEIFPASFRDTNKDGVGDIKGIISKIDHLDKLGVRAITLNSIFPSEHYPEHYDRTENLTRIEPLLGTLDDFKLLTNQLHKHNISLILDIPLSPYFKQLNPQSYQVKAIKEEQQQETSSSVHHVIVNNHILNSNGLNATSYSSEDQSQQVSLVKILQFWLEYGVDGFYLKGLERFVNDDKFEENVRAWRHMLNTYTMKNDFNKIMICSQNVVKILENNGGIVNSKLNTVLAFFDLVDYRMELAGGDFKQQIDAVQKGVLFSKPNYPWPLWRVGSEDRPRLASRVEANNGSLAALLVNMMLPGTPSIFYGDEIGLDNIHDPDGEREDISHVHQLSPMRWTENGFTQPGVLPWLPSAVSQSPKNSLDVISEMSNFRDVTPSIYMHAVWKEGALIPNCAIRYTDKDLIVVERSYPRRHSYVTVANLGSKAVQKDLSSIYYRGTVVLGTNSKQLIGRHITFQSLVLYPGEAVIVKLDK